MPRYSSLLLAGLMPLLAACATDGAGTAGAPAPAPATGAAPATAGRTFGVTTTVAEPVDFVRQSRTGAEAEFIPVGVTPPPRGTQRRDAAGVQNLEKELQAQRDRSRNFARRPAPAPSYDGRIPPRPAAPAPASED